MFSVAGLRVYTTSLRTSFINRSARIRLADGPSGNHPCVDAKEDRMDEQTDEAKGRVKEAAGDLTDNKDLKREGKLDQTGAKVKKKTGEAVDEAKEKVDRVLDDDK